MKTKCLTAIMLLMCGIQNSNCQSQPIKKRSSMANNITITEADTSNTSIKERLKKQLYDGCDMFSQEDGASIENTYNFLELSDAKTLIPVVKKILLSNGFRFDTAKAHERFKEVFRPMGGTIYPIHCVGEPCEGGGNNYDFSESRTDLFFLHEGFMTMFFYLPEIIDYQKQYPDLATLENDIPKKQSKKMKDGTVEKVEIVKWKDSDTVARSRKKNIDDLVAINCYLFNNNKAYVPYLISKLPDFVENLVKTYGYTKEPAFNKYVLEKYVGAGDVQSSNYSNDLRNFGELLFTKDCGKHLVIRKDLLDYVAQHTDSADTKLMSALNYYASDFSENDKDKVIYKKYSLSERRKILAYASCVCDPYYIKGYYGKNGIPSNIQSALLAYTLHYDPAAEQEYKLHNYYGLPNLKELINTVKTGTWMDGPW